VINGVEYKLSGKDYVTVDGSVTFQSHNDDGGEIESGFLPFDSNDEDYTIWIAGDNFLSKFITVYDRDNDLVGIGYPD